MSITTFMKKLAIFISLITLNVAALSAQQNNKKPNVLIFYADDLGWGDLSFNNGKTPTPNIDKIFKRGTTFKNYGTHAVCSPSRAGLLTGKHYVSVNAGPETGGELDLKETTIAESFQKEGYVTGAFGKWHNGDPPNYGKNPTPKIRKKFKQGHGVNSHGFDRFVGYYGGGGNYFNRYTNYYYFSTWYHDKENMPDEKGYTTDLITKYAIDFMTENKEKSFLCYIPHEAMHNPLHAKYEDILRVPESVKQGEKLLSEQEYMSYFEDEKKWRKLSKKQIQIVRSAMLISLDDAIGKTIQFLKDQQLYENTIILFASDNGATPQGNNLPLRGGKHTVYEGGIHVPSAILWEKGGLNQGKTFEGDFGYLDVYPTLSAMAGVKDKALSKIDGKDFSKEILTNTKKEGRYKNWVWRQQGAVKNDKWKLIYNLQSMQLYDLENDISETNNLAKKHPSIVAELKLEHEKFLKKNNCNPTYVIPKNENIKPKPQGDVLEFYAEQIKKVQNPRKGMRFVFSIGYPKDKNVLPGDVIEYDICVAKDGREDGFYYTPTRGWSPMFIQNTGYDQFGRLQTTAPKVIGGKGVWEHRVIGVGNVNPLRIPFNVMALVGKNEGLYHFYIDNLIVRREDGSKIVLWQDKSNTFRRWNEKPFMMTPKNNAFKDVKINTIPLSSVQ